MPDFIIYCIKAREEGCALRAIQLLGKVKEGSKKRSFVGKLQVVVYLLVYGFLIKKLESWWWKLELNSVNICTDL